MTVAFDERRGLAIDEVDAPDDLFDERVPPHDHDAERAILGNLLYAGSLPDGDLELSRMADAASPLRPDHFESGGHRLMYVAIEELRARGKRVDDVTLCAHLEETGRLQQVDAHPREYIASLTTTCGVVIPRHLAAYVEIVVNRWRQREAIELGHRLTSLGYDPGTDPDVLVGLIEAKLATVRRPDARTVSTVPLLDGGALAAPLPDVEYLVREIGLVSGGGAPHLVAGYGFTGKTLAMQSLAVSLAAGRPAWGAYGCRKPWNVVHVDLEQGDRLTRRRYQRIARAMGVELASLGSALTLAVMPPLRLTAECADGWRRIMRGRDLIIVDSLRAATGGQDENSSEIRAGLDMLGALSDETQCRALVIHHARKPSADDPGGRYAIRGSGAIFDAVDCAYIFAAGQGEPVSVEQVKARSHGEPVPTFALVISDVEVDGDPRAGVRVQVHAAELVSQRRAEQARTVQREQTTRDVDTVRKVLGDRPGLSVRDLRALVRPMSRERLDAALVELRDTVEVREERRGRATARLHYLRGGSS